MDAVQFGGFREWSNALFSKRFAPRQANPEPYRLDGADMVSYSILVRLAFFLSYPHCRRPDVLFRRHLCVVKLPNIGSVQRSPFSLPRHSPPHPTSIGVMKSPHASSVHLTSFLAPTPILSFRLHASSVAFAMPPTAHPGMPRFQQHFHEPLSFFQVQYYQGAKKNRADVIYHSGGGGSGGKGAKGLP
ncbi:uncharacterized protein EI90DRAFT_2108558 [Cantharellus anzutake]|uniref:uncharacterized protein n=1 Tax=Cantharellus anzutake TaxID=1750568 RepID=UPI001904F3FC|nr:uncharacterized protein EI90DRAFT_2108558 [Cantharellus anzutake]KAF8325635.1 hypothetical protein EI90DRAFT_2108558 [Cantharellus anzutake]